MTAYLSIEARLLRQFTRYFEREFATVLYALRENVLDLKPEFEKKIHDVTIPEIHLERKKILQFLSQIFPAKDLLSGYEITKRELECVRLFMMSKTAREIAKELHLSVRTIEHRLDSIKGKLGCRTKSELLSRLQRMHDVYILIDDV